MTLYQPMQKKLVERYGITPQSNVVGVSLGGVITVEISCLIPLDKAIIVSSIKSASEFPWYFKLFRNLPVYKIIPHSFYSSIGYLIKPLFGKMRGKPGFMFVDMIKNSSPVFMRWAMHAFPFSLQMMDNWQPRSCSFFASSHQRCYSCYWKRQPRYDLYPWCRA